MPNLVLIGPHKIGKSTIAHWISRSCGDAPRISLDDPNRPWYRNKQPAFAQSIKLVFGDPEKERLFKLAEATSVQQALHGIDRTIVDFGAGHSVYDVPEHFEMVRSALAGHQVVLLLPSIDNEISRRTLHERYGNAVELCELADTHLSNGSNRRLAQIFVYTNGKSSTDIAQEILERIPNWHTTPS